MAAPSAQRRHALKILERRDELAIFDLAGDRDGTGS